MEGFANIYDKLNQQPDLQALIQDFYYESLELTQQANEAFKLNNTNFKLLMEYNQHEANWGQDDHMPLHQVARGIFGMREYYTLPFSITQVCSAMLSPTKTEVETVTKIHKLGL